MKKLWVILLVVFLAGCSSVQNSYPELDKPIQIKQVDEKELVQLLQSEYAVIVYAIPGDDWSQIAMQYLNTAAQSVGVEISYFNIEQDRDKDTDLYHLAYDPIVRYLRQSDYFEIIYDELYAPTVVVIDQGEIVDLHIGTVSGHILKEGLVPPLTLEQGVELKNIYYKMLQ